VKIPVTDLARSVIPEGAGPVNLGFL
jgi:hypothetical protein